jgi:hypothetical protein
MAVCGNWAERGEGQMGRTRTWAQTSYSFVYSFMFLSNFRSSIQILNLNLVADLHLDHLFSLIIPQCEEVIYL